MSEKTQAFLEGLKNSYFGRWIVKYRISFLVIILILAYGTIVAINIPKESSPDIKFGVVQITTVYPGANPVDVDGIITKKIEDEVKGLDGIDTIGAKSVLGASIVSITLKNDIDTKNFINDVKNKIDNLVFPDDVKKPQVMELSSSNQIMFQMILYGSQKQFTMNQMRTIAMKFKDLIKDKGGIVDVKIDGLSADSDYDILVKLNQQKVESYGLTVAGVMQQIKAYNQNLPLGNHDLGKLSYDYRISNELRSIEDLKNVPIKVNDTYIKLSDLSEIERDYKNKSITYGGVYGSKDNYAVSISIYKQKGGNVFAISKDAKDLIATTLKRPQFSGVKSQYTNDVSENINDDYNSLGKSGAISVILVFIITMLFVGFRQALIATLSMLLSFMITFMSLQWLGLSMNFLTNFSLILSFGVGIDTVVVFIQAAWENMQRGYNPTTAMLMAVNTYQSANINTSIINAIVFIPLLTLPGVTGKFLAYIPITIFATLVATLFLALTVNNALFAKFNTQKDHYYIDDDDHMILSDAEKEILDLERQGKEPRRMTQGSKFDAAIKRMSMGYVSILRRVLQNRLRRAIAIVGPIAALIITFVLLAPSIGFKLFPSGDNPLINIAITAKEGTNTTYLVTQASGVDQIISAYPEVKSYTVTIQNNQINAAVILVKKGQRTRDSFTIQDSLLGKLKTYEKYGFKVEGKVQAGGPPSGKAIGLKLVAGDKNLLPTLKKVSQDFEDYIKSLTGTVNVSNSSTNSPGQFTLNFDKERLADLGLTPQDLQSEIYGSINGIKAGTITIDNIDRDVVLKIDTYADQVNPESVRNLIVNTKSGPVTVGQVADVTTNPALTTVNRSQSDIVITVEADLDKNLKPTDFQPKLTAFADKYQFPAGITYKQSGENEANKDLIAATQRAFLISLFLAFIVLVYQFNSFSKPAVILYSVFTAFLGVNVGLFVTGNPYSMAVAIGIISLLGVVINTAIFLIDRINENMNKGATIEEAIYEAGNTRFKPILITKLTTILGVATSVTQDPFYAGLGYTVIFGLIFAGLITLISIPTIFYVVFRKTSNGGMIGRLRTLTIKIMNRLKRRYYELNQ